MFWVFIMALELVFLEYLSISTYQIETESPTLSNYENSTPLSNCKKVMYGEIFQFPPPGLIIGCIPSHGPNARQA